MIAKNKHIALWIIWLFVWPLSIALIYFNWPMMNMEGQYVDVLFFGLLMSIVAFFPLIVGNTPVFFVHGISFAVFLSFGLFVEVVLMQMAVLVLLFGKLRIRKDELFRVPLNMLLFLFVSIIAAAVFTLLGGDYGDVYLSSSGQLIAIVSYVVTVFVSNQVLLYLCKTLIYGKETRFFDKAMLWEVYTTLLMLPVGFVLYIMYRNFDLFGLIVVGISFISISIVLMLFHASKRINYYLQQTSEIGHQLSGQLEVNEVVDLFIERVTKLLPIDYAFVYEVIDDEILKMIRFFDKQQKLDFPTKDHMEKFESISGTVWAENKAAIYDSQKQWKHLKTDLIPINGESVMSLPVSRNNKTVAVITLFSKKKRAFEKYQFMILDILINHLAVALENAKNYEETKNRSQTDPLTNLYNYRYFEDYIQNYFEKRNNHNAPVSLILLDLDYFKEVNDTYGHQSGNEVLQGLATLLTNVVGDDGIIARYGGEEFVVLLPSKNQAQCLYLAEVLRKAIANQVFLISRHILEDDVPQQVRMTASIGVATYPDNCEHPLELIRHADRAMYVGAKQKGRNRVAIYEKLDPVN